jgi:hypothetical protein
MLDGDGYRAHIFVIKRGDGFMEGEDAGVLVELLLFPISCIVGTGLGKQVKAVPRLRTSSFSRLWDAVLTAAVMVPLLDIPS